MRSQLRLRYQALRRLRTLALGLRPAPLLGLNRRRAAPFLAAITATELRPAPPVVVAAGTVTYLPARVLHAAEPTPT